MDTVGQLDYNSVRSRDNPGSPSEVKFVIKEVLLVNGNPMDRHNALTPKSLSEDQSAPSTNVVKLGWESSAEHIGTAAPDSQAYELVGAHPIQEAAEPLFPELAAHNRLGKFSVSSFSFYCFPLPDI